MTYSMGLFASLPRNQWAPLPAKEPSTDGPLVIDQDRMNKALRSKRHVMPQGLTREQRRAEFMRVAQEEEKASKDELHL